MPSAKTTPKRTKKAIPIIRNKKNSIDFTQFQREKSVIEQKLYIENEGLREFYHQQKKWSDLLRWLLIGMFFVSTILLLLKGFNLVNLSDVIIGIFIGGNSLFGLAIITVLLYLFPKKK